MIKRIGRICISVRVSEYDVFNVTLNSLGRVSVYWGRKSQSYAILEIYKVGETHMHRYGDDEQE